MHIPRVWTKTSGDGQTIDGRAVPVTVWGWGDDEASATRGAAGRLQSLLDRIRLGEPFPDRYAYGARPLREEILQTVEGALPGEPAAFVTRNSYGAQVLSTARIPFLDIDLQPPTLLQRLRRMFGSGQDQSEEALLTKLRELPQQFGRATFGFTERRRAFEPWPSIRNSTPSRMMCKNSCWRRAQTPPIRASAWCNAAFAPALRRSHGAARCLCLPVNILVWTRNSANASPPG